jgi:serine/threonine protein phosphatase PrpC
MPDVHTIHYDPSTNIALLSDGVRDVMSNSDIHTILSVSHKQKTHYAQTLVQEAYNRGSNDNLTAVVIRVL